MTSTVTALTTGTERFGTPEERVARGRAWLNQNHAGWEMDVDLDLLDLSSACDCVLGQIVKSVKNSDEWIEQFKLAFELSDDDEVEEYDGFDVVCTADVQYQRDLLADINGLSDLVLTEDQAREMGFHLFVTSYREVAERAGRTDVSSKEWQAMYDREWAELTAEWRKVIIEQREG